MPDTVSISITTNNISTTNAIKMAIYKDSAPLAIIASIDEPAGVHLARTWNFAGLERVMHFYKLLELDSSNNVIAVLIGPIYFLPSDNTIEVKDAVLIQVGATPIPGDEGNIWPAGVNNVTVPDWIGWNIEMFERVGQGSMKFDVDSPVDITYNVATGYLQLNNPGDVFYEDPDSGGEWFIARFKPRVTTAGSVGLSSASGFSDILVVTANTVLTEADMGKKILIAPAGNYLEITLPSLPLVIALRLIYFEMAPSDTMKCAKIIQAGGDSPQYIQWLEGNLTALWICPSESIELYKRTMSSVDEWGVNNDNGNFKTVGERVYDDMTALNTFNKALTDGALLDVYQYARLYNRVVLRLTANVIPYASWSFANVSKYKFSLKDTATNNFHIYEGRYLYDRPSNGGLIPGDFQRMMIERHKHVAPYSESHDPPYGEAGDGFKIGSNSTDFDNHSWFTNDGSEIGGNQMNLTGVIGEETRPNSRITYGYIRV